MGDDVFDYVVGPPRPAVGVVDPIALQSLGEDEDGGRDVAGGEGFVEGVFHAEVEPLGAASGEAVASAVEHVDDGVALNSGVAGGDPDEEGHALVERFAV